MLRFAPLLIAFALLAAPASAAPPQARPFVNGNVTSALVDGDTLYVGGSFETVGGTPAGALAILGAQDGALRRTFPGLTGSGESNTVEAPPLHVAAMTPDGAGGWFAGGTFSQVDGVPRDSLVHLRADGTVDPAFRADVVGTVTALARRGDALYVGGDFIQRVSGEPAGSVTAVDARTGARLPWTSGTTMDDVEVLEVDGDRLYVGGGGVTALDADTGARLPWSAAVGRVRDVAVRGGVVYVAAGHDGAVAVRRDDASRLPIDFAGVDEAHAVVATDAAVIWGGRGDDDRALIASDPATGADRGWFAGVTGEGQIALALDGDRVFAGLPRMRAFDVRTGASLSWDTPFTGGRVTAFAAAGGEVIVGGALGSVGGVARRNLAAFDLRTGAVKPFAADTTVRDTGRLEDPRVHALAKAGGVLYVGGRFDSIAGAAQSNLAALDPVTGARLDFPSTPLTTFSLTTDGSSLFAGGGSIGLQGALWAFDLARRTPRGTVSFDCDVTALALVGPTVHAGGCFDGMLAGFRAADLAPVPGPAVHGSTVHALAPDGAGGLWLGGEFTGVDGVPSPNLAHVRGSGAVASDAPRVDGHVTALRADGDTLTVGGRFNRLQGAARANAGQVRLSDGSVTAFAPEPGGAPRVFVPLADGGTFMGGWFGWTTLAYTGGLARIGGATASPEPTPIPDPTATATPEPEPTATATPEPAAPTVTASPGPVLVGPAPPATTPRAPAPTRARSPRAPTPRLVATRAGIVVRLDRPATTRLAVRVLAAGRLLGRTTVRPGARRARLTLTRRGRAVLRGTPTVTVEIDAVSVRVQLKR